MILIDQNGNTRILDKKDEGREAYTAMMQSSIMHYSWCIVASDVTHELKLMSVLGTLADQVNGHIGDDCLLDQAAGAIDAGNKLAKVNYDLVNSSPCIVCLFGLKLKYFRLTDAGMDQFDAKHQAVEMLLTGQYDSLMSSVATTAMAREWYIDYSA